ncbi:hypothetical protein T484DRAFT_1920445, partial [Baffinella frigidus]
MMDFSRITSVPSMLAAMQNPKMLLSDPSMLAAMQNPKMLLIFAESEENPAAMIKHQNDSEVMAFFGKMVDDEA